MIKAEIVDATTTDGETTQTRYSLTAQVGGYSPDVADDLGTRVATMRTQALQAMADLEDDYDDADEDTE